MSRTLAARALAALLTLGSVGCGASAGANPLLHLEPVDTTPRIATLDEVLPAGSYAYLRVGDAWHATLNDGFVAGDRVEIRGVGLAHGWRSARLGRELGDVVFAAVSAAPPDAATLASAP